VVEVPGDALSGHAQPADRQTDAEDDSANGGAPLGLPGEDRECGPGGRQQQTADDVEHLLPGLRVRRRTVVLVVLRSPLLLFLLLGPLVFLVFVLVAP